MAVRQRAGLMRRRITVETATASTTVYGTVEYSWSSSTIGSLWAQVVTEGGTEAFGGETERNEERALFRIRYRSDVDTENRVVYPAGSTKAWDIEAATDLEGCNKILELRAVHRARTT